MLGDAWKVIGAPASCIALSAVRARAIAFWRLAWEASASGPWSRDIGGRLGIVGQFAVIGHGTEGGSVGTPGR